MTDYVIYTFGSGEIITNILNTLALLCKSDTLFFRPVMVLSASLGGVWVALKSIWGHNIGAFLKGWMIPTFLIFNIMFLPRVTVHVIDQVDTFHHYTKVDHVPVGVALVGHIASTIAYHLTEEIEKRLVPASYEEMTSSKSGLMFAAYLMAASRDLMVTDPTLRENLKAYIDQCYTWPYLYTNIPPGREEALRTPNILEFMKTNPHQGLGMYWKERGGGTKFLMCQEVPNALFPEMKEESAGALTRLASQVMPGISVQAPEHAQGAIASVGENAWHALAQDSSTAHQRVEQQMVINAAREAIDDSFERFGNQRRNPRLLSYSATRGEEQQNTGALISGVLAARQLPLLQGVFLGLLLMSFVIVVAFTFIPGGLQIWGMWIKMIIWVESWPIFYGILNCIGLLWLEKSNATIIYTYGPGITWLTQTGLADSAWNAYAIVQNMCLAVPFLSWALISKSGQALVSMAERLLPTVGRALGQSIVDNTQTFDTQSFHNRSLNSFQMAQQNLGSNYSLSSIRDDGQFQVISSSSGSQVIKESVSQGKHMINASDAISSQFSKQLGRESSAMESTQASYSKTKNEILDQSYELVKSFAEGKAAIKGASESQNKETQIAAQELLSATTRNAHQQGISKSEYWEHSMGASLEASAGFKILGTGASIKGDISTRGSTKATRDSTNQSSRETGLTLDASERVTQGLTAALNNQVTFTDDASRRVGESFRGSVSNLESYSEQLSAQKSKVERLSEMGSLLESQGVSVTQSLNDDVLEYIASHHHLSKEEAARWASTHSNEFQNEANTYLEGWTSHMTHWLESKTGPMNPSAIDDAYLDYKKGISLKEKEMSENGLTQVREMTEKEGLGEERIKNFDKETLATQDQITASLDTPEDDFKEVESKLGSNENAILQEQKDLKKTFENKKEDVLAVRAAKNIMKGD